MKQQDCRVSLSVEVLKTLRDSGLKQSQYEFPCFKTVIVLNSAVVEKIHTSGS